MWELVQNLDATMKVPPPPKAQNQPRWKNSQSPAPARPGYCTPWCVTAPWSLACPFVLCRRASAAAAAGGDLRADGRLLPRLRHARPPVAHPPRPALRGPPRHLAPPLPIPPLPGGPSHRGTANVPLFLRLPSQGTPMRWDGILSTKAITATHGRCENAA